MHIDDEIRLIRNRIDALELAVDALPRNAGSASYCFLGKTTSLGSYPTVAQSVYAVVPILDLSPMREAGAPVLTAESGVCYATNVGGSIPPVGTYLLVYHTPDRLAFQYG